MNICLQLLQVPSETVALLSPSLSSKLRQRVPQTRSCGLPRARSFCHSSRGGPGKLCIDGGEGRGEEVEFGVFIAVANENAERPQLTRDFGGQC